MPKLIHSYLASLDGYVADAVGNFERTMYERMIGWKNDPRIMARYRGRHERHHRGHHRGSLHQSLRRDVHPYQVGQNFPSHEPDRGAEGTATTSSGPAATL